MPTTLFDDVLDFITHPSVAPHLANMLVNQTHPSKDYQAELTTRIDKIEAEFSQKHGGGRKKKSNSDQGSSQDSNQDNNSTVTVAEVGSITSLADIRDHTVDLAAALKEAARFARRDINHPDAVQRLNDARKMADELTEAERYVLSPERVPDNQRRAVDAILPLIRTTRELTLNSLTSAAGISDAAAAAGNAAMALQMAVATGAVPTFDAKADPLYGRATALESGCVECGDAHLAAVAATLRKSAKDAVSKGWTDPDVQSRLAFAQEELAALLTYDWTPEKIANNSHTEQTVLRSYAKQVNDLLTQVRNANSSESLSKIAVQATGLREGFRSDLPQKFQMITLGGANRDSGVDFSKLELFGLPTQAQVQEVTTGKSSVLYFDNIKNRLRDRSVKVVYRQPQSGTVGIIIEGEYAPATNQVSLNPAAMDKEDPYHLQVLIHEGVHALLHNKQCLPISVITPQIRDKAEEATELTVIAALTELGMPLEDRDGNVVMAASRGVDWELLRKHVDPQMFEDVKWATDWMVKAAQGADGELAAEMCPALRSVTAPVQSVYVQPVGLKVEPGPISVFTSRKYIGELAGGDYIRLPDDTPVQGIASSQWVELTDVQQHGPWIKLIWDGGSATLNSYMPIPILVRNPPQDYQHNVEPRMMQSFTLTVNQKRRLAEAALKQYQAAHGTALQQFQGPEGYIVRVAPVSGGLGIGLVGPSGEYERIMTVPQGDESLAGPDEEDESETSDDSFRDTVHISQGLVNRINKLDKQYNELYGLFERESGVSGIHPADITPSERANLSRFNVEADKTLVELQRVQGEIDGLISQYNVMRTANPELPPIDVPLGFERSQKVKQPLITFRREVIVCPPIVGGVNHG